MDIYKNVLKLQEGQYMIDRYIILNRTPKIIIKLFIINIFLITGIVIWGINTLMYQKFLQIHSEILNVNSYYLFKVLIPVKEVKTITNNNKLWIEKKEYQYKVKTIDNKVIYQKNQNYIPIYLEVKDVEKEYLIDGYQLDIKIEKEKKKIIDYLKE